MRRTAKKISIPEVAATLDEVKGSGDINTGKSKEITERIMQLMESKPWLQKELAENMGKSDAEISKLLSGNHNFTLRTIEKFEVVLGADIIMVPKTSSVQLGKVVSIKSVATDVTTNPVNFENGRFSKVEIWKDEEVLEKAIK